jgi:hypothetical protein
MVAVIVVRSMMSVFRIGYHYHGISIEISGFSTAHIHTYTTFFFVTVTVRLTVWAPLRCKELWKYNNTLMFIGPCIILIGE